MEKSVVIIQLTEEEKTDLFRMRSEGCSMREISEYIGCSVSAKRTADLLKCTMKV